MPDPFRTFLAGVLLAAISSLVIPGPDAAGQDGKGVSIPNAKTDAAGSKNAAPGSASASPFREAFQDAYGLADNSKPSTDDKPVDNLAPGNRSKRPGSIAGSTEARSPLRQGADLQDKDYRGTDQLSPLTGRLARREPGAPLWRHDNPPPPKRITPTALAGFDSIDKVPSGSVSRNQPERFQQAPPEPTDQTLTRAALLEGKDAMTWWQPLVMESIEDRQTQTVSPEQLIQFALQNSPVILATSLRPLIRETEITEAAAVFDPEFFVRSQFDDRVDPVGNQLTTGNGEPFLEENIWSGETGFRRRLKNGGEFEFGQRFGFQNSNSLFFDPQDQGTSTLSLNYSQPLLRGKGAAVNRSQIVIAQIGRDASWDQYATELQAELTDVVEAYWTLYFQRSSLLQQQYSVERGEAILRRLEGRAQLDSLPSQVARARAAVQARRTELANAYRDVKNAETDIRRLIGSRENFQAVAPELLPLESPLLLQTGQQLDHVIQIALQNRPEIKQAMQRSRIAAVQRNVSENELLPELNLIFSTYVSALRGESQVLEAFVDQFDSVPGYGVGIEFNMPAGRRAARARNQQQELVLRQIRHEIDQTVNDVVAEVQIAWRQVDSAYQTTLAAAESIQAARTDLLQNEARWESFALIEGDLADGQTPTTLLDQLLDAQQRLTNSEFTFSQALLEFKIAEVNLKRASGTLLSHQPLPGATSSANGNAPAIYTNPEFHAGAPGHGAANQPAALPPHSTGSGSR